MQSLNGEPIKFFQDDLEIKYLDLRRFFSAENCLELIQAVKKVTGKKCAVFFGNCNMSAVRKFLLRNTKFRREYFLLELPDDWWYDKTRWEFVLGGGGQLFQTVDLLGMQRDKSRNSHWFFVPSDEIVSWCRSDAKIFYIPRTIFEGYFPQHFAFNPRDAVDAYGNRKFPYGDKYLFKIMELAPMNPDLDKILDQICDENFMTSAEIQAHLDKSIASLYSTEHDCDIKLADYVEENCMDQQIYYSPGHPTQTVILELARRILRFIEIKSDNFLRISNMLNEKNLSVTMRGQDVPVYPCVKKFFNFQESQDEYWANRYTWDFSGNFRDFQREYIKHCWAEKFTE